jgi:hypothetical protein
MGCEPQKFGGDMTNIIDLSAHRPDPNAPDADCVTTDPQGRDMALFLVCFTHDGAEVGLHIWAYDFDDAEDRVQSIRSSASVYGQISSNVPA